MNIYAIKELLLQANPVSIHYLNRYIKLIEHFQNNPTKEKYTEEHHILPKSMFPEYKNEKWNLISLSAEYHFLAHRILWEAFRNPQMTYAFWLMSNTKEGNIKFSKIYKRLKEDNQKYLSEINSGELNPMYGKQPWNKGKSYEIPGRKEKWKEDQEFVEMMKAAQHSEESRQKRREKMSGRKISDEHKLKISLANKNKYYPKEPPYIYHLFKDNGEIIETDNLAKYQKENNLSNLNKLFKGVITRVGPFILIIRKDKGSKLLP